MYLDFRTPEDTIFEGEVSTVSLPGRLGRFQVLDRHAPLLSTLVVGSVEVRSEGGLVRFAIGRGVAEVSGRQLRVLVDSATRA